MTDGDGDAPHQSAPAHDRELAAPDAGLGAALEGLEQADRNFSIRFGGRHPSPEPPAQDPEPTFPRSSFDERVRAAEREATAYLEDAKRRADSLVNAMVAAVEREAAEMRREAEAGIRARWEAIEIDAARHLDEARRVADRLVAERQRRIAALSDGITGRAQALTAGLEDAERVRAQFDSFVRALSEAAATVAADAVAKAPKASGGEYVERGATAA
jgi:hypothetical protein